MNTYKKIVHIWLSFVSISGFLVGWVFLGRATEMNYVTDTASNTDGNSITVSFAPIPQIVEPVSAADNGGTVNITTNNQVAQASTFTTRPRRLRTRAS